MPTTVIIWVNNDSPAFAETAARAVATRFPGAQVRRANPDFFGQLDPLPKADAVCVRARDEHVAQAYRAAGVEVLTPERDESIADQAPRESASVVSTDTAQPPAPDPSPPRRRGRKRVSRDGAHG